MALTAQRKCASLQLAQYMSVRTLYVSTCLRMYLSIAKLCVEAFCTRMLIYFSVVLLLG
jgi:hypothetical protein